MKKIVFFIIVLFFIITKQSMATHAAGMDISYRYIGSQSGHQITVNVVDGGWLIKGM